MSKKALAQSQISPSLPLWGIGFIVIILQILSQNHPFFWDSIQLGAKHGLWYYEQQFSSFWLPASIDSGHPPFFGMYLAAGWFMFGKNLLVAHWLMFPFLLLLFYNAWRLGQDFLENQKAWLFPLFLLLDPGIAAQLFIVGPDLALLAFFTLTLRGVLSHRPQLILFGIIGLGMISMRGMMCGFALCLYDLIFNREGQRFSIKMIWNKLAPYLPGAFLMIAFLVAHYLHAGWIGYHQDSPWAGSFQVVGIKDIGRQALVLVWRLLDFGRIGLWIIMLYLVIRNRGQLAKEKWKPLLWIGGLLFLLLAWPFLRYIGVNQHRYLLPFILITYLFFLQLWKELSNHIQKTLLLASLGICLLLGNLWVYPETISQGWDSSLLHWKYHSQLKEAESFLQEQQIPFNQVGTAFPAIGAQKNRYLNEIEDGFKAYDFGKDRLILYANVMNDFSDEEIAQLQNTWTPIFKSEKLGVKVIIYSNEEVKTGRTQ